MKSSLIPANATSSLVWLQSLFLCFYPRGFSRLSFGCFTCTCVAGVSSREKSRAYPKIAEAARPSPTRRPCGDSAMTEAVEALSVSLRLPLRAVVQRSFVRLSFPRYLLFSLDDFNERWHSLNLVTILRIQEFKSKSISQNNRRCSVCKREIVSVHRLRYFSTHSRYRFREQARGREEPRIRGEFTLLKIHCHFWCVYQWSTF